MMIGPSDLFDTITDPETEFAYVGSYIGSSGNNRNPQPGGGGGAGNAFRRLISEPSALMSEKLHQQWIQSVKFSPDGSRVVTASWDKTAKILDLTSGQEKTIRHGHSVNSAAFSPDGRCFAIVDETGGFHLFSLENIDQSFLERQLQNYNGDFFVGAEGQLRAKLRRAELQMAFKKAKELNQMTREQAEKLMNTHIRRADYRGFRTATDRATTGDDAHIWGIINQVWPLTP